MLFSKWRYFRPKKIRHSLASWRTLILVFGIAFFTLVLSPKKEHLLLAYTEGVFNYIGNTSGQYFGREYNSITYDKVAIEYSNSTSTNAYICSLNVAISRTNTTTSDAVILTVRSGNTIPEQGSIVTTATVNAADMSLYPTYQRIKFTFQNCWLAEKDSKWNFVFERTGSISTTNYYFISASTYTNPPPGTNQSWLHYGGTWYEQNLLGDLNLLGFNNVTIVEQFQEPSIAILQNTFPFAYFYDIKNIFSSYSTSSSDNFPTLGIKTSTSSAIYLDVTLISKDKINEYFGSNNITLFKGITAIMIWASVGAYFYFTIFKLF